MTTSHEHDITVGIVAYNTPIPILTRTVASLREHYPDLPLIILCNSSSDAYQREIAGLCKSWRIDCLSHQPNAGFGAGHNRIVQDVGTPWYVCCNPDVVVYANTLTELRKATAKLPDASIVAPKIVDEHGLPAPVIRPHITLANLLKRSLLRILRRAPRSPIVTDQGIVQSQFISGCFFMVDVAKFRACGGFDESFFLYGEDADLSRRLEKFGSNYVALDAVVTHLWSRASGQSARLMFHHIKSIFRYFCKHGLWV